jgi:hypothetical protein
MEKLIWYFGNGSGRIGSESEPVPVKVCCVVFKTPH